MGLPPHGDGVFVECCGAGSLDLLWKGHRTARLPPEPERWPGSVDPEWDDIQLISCSQEITIRWFEPSVRFDSVGNTV